jgi:ABC-2 type transport system ATP-binding protein
MAEPMPAIEVTGLTKRYGPATSGQLAVDHINFHVSQGEVFGFLGPNGVGKTTTIRLLTGLCRPTAGQASVLGLGLAHDLPRIKKQVGVVPETSNLYDELSAQDNLVFSMGLYGVPRHERVPRAEELLDRFRLADKRDTAFAKLSRGMKRALTFSPGQTRRMIDVTIVDDARGEPDETVVVMLSHPQNATLGTVISTTLTIQDNDGAVYLPLVVR